MSQVTKLNRGSLAVIFLTVFIDLLGFAMVLPLLPIYAKQFQRELSPMMSGIMIGLLMASFSIMQFIFAPLWGRLSDRVGRRPVLLFGLAGAAITYGLFGLATMWASTIGLFVSRIGAGIACATIPIAQAYIADTTTLEKRAKGMAIIGAAFGIGFCFGPLLGAAALAFSPQAELSPWPGFVAAGLSALAFLLALAKLPESLTPGAQAAERGGFDFGAWKETLAIPSVAGILAASFISVASFGAFETTLSTLLKSHDPVAEKSEETKTEATPAKDFGLNSREVLYFFSFIGVTLTIAQGGVVRRLSGRVREGDLASAGVVLSLVGLLLLYAAIATHHFWGLVIASGIEVFGFACITPSLQALISRRSDPAKQGSTAGVSQSVSALARIVGPLWAFPLFSMNPGLPYAVSAGLMLIGLIVLRLAVRSGHDFEPTTT